MNLKTVLIHALGEVSIAEMDAKEHGHDTLAATCRAAGDHIIQAIREFEQLSRECEVVLVDGPEVYVMNVTNGVYP